VSDKTTPNEVGLHLDILYITCKKHHTYRHIYQNVWNLVIRPTKIIQAVYNQTCIKRSPIGQRKSDLI